MVAHWVEVLGRRPDSNEILQQSKPTAQYGLLFTPSIHSQWTEIDGSFTDKRLLAQLAQLPERQRLQRVQLIFVDNVWCIFPEVSFRFNRNSLISFNSSEGLSVKRTIDVCKADHLENSVHWGGGPLMRQDFNRKKDALKEWTEVLFRPWSAAAVQILDL